MHCPPPTVNDKVTTKTSHYRKYRGQRPRIAQLLHRFDHDPAAVDRSVEAMRWRIASDR